MALLNPVYGLVVPFFCICTLPLAIFAGITTTVAVSILMFRVAIVYVNIALAFIPQYIMGYGPYRAFPAAYHTVYGGDRSLAPTSSGNTIGAAKGRNNSSLALAVPLGMGYAASGHRSPKARERSGATALCASNALFSNSLAGHNGPGHGRRSRRPSSATSIGSITPINEVEENMRGRSGSWVLASSGMDRDFEGVGGWRLDDDNDDADWAKINSRLELPLERAQRHHYRSSSSDPVTPGDGWLMMKSAGKERRDRNSATRQNDISPNSGRARTNHNISVSFSPRDREESYFGYAPPASSPKSVKKFAAPGY